MPSAIRFASFLGDNAFEFYRQVVAYLGEASGTPTEMVADTSAGLEAMFGEGQIEAAFGCGLPYVWKAAEESPSVRLMAAPVLPAERYQDRPVYFSDVIVRADAPFNTFADLRGATFAYNQAVSFSGYVLPLYHLLTLGETNGFFGKTVASGSHAASMNWVESGQADAAAIDSVVLEMELAQRPERASAFRVVASLGPAGMPPVITSTRLDPETHARLTRALVSMHTDERGRGILRQGGVRRFAPVTDRNYDDIRQMLAALREAGVKELR
ncbi:MAG: phosphate/phosphite/phosphonate ABC transporter substrate-binding protein [Anaerolineales bacterium]